ncbi:uncharacterized protein LOC134771674 isoform X1 [Penaeus indicus]|uniref:uncharacterized protein LOC134771674 isoform X1 n=1 Tax=Penaeus indicus TaxID=29960 RepID=UPI00300C36A8
MLRLAFPILLALGGALAQPLADKILEGDLTTLMQEALAPYDPSTVPAITNLNIVTDHGSFLFNATNVVVAGFGLVEVTSFVPPVPLLSKHVSMSLRVPLLEALTQDYSLIGDHVGTPIDAAGTGQLKFTNFDLKVDFKADSYSLDPMSVCVQPGSFSIDLGVESIESNLEGAGEINDDINAEGPALLEGVEAQINANSDAIEQLVNGALCVQLKYRN